MTQFDWHRAVIKVGSALIAPNGEKCSGQYLLPIARYISECRQKGKEIILVSSGSVAAGRSLIDHGELPLIAEKQAMAAVGQSLMMANWQRFFDFPCAQILVTHEDLSDRRRYINIQNTIRALLDNGILPIVNENDSVATKALKIGDNDNLGALVALVSTSDLLMICSDIDGLFDKDPRKHSDAKLISVVDQVTEDIYALAGDTNNKIATGGMKTKIQAAERATQEGINTMIVNGQKSRVFDDLLARKKIGTLFKRQASPQKARKNWLQHSLKIKGSVTIDIGAVQALKQNGASLLSIGITACKGKFGKGDAINITDPKGKHIAKGISQYNNREINQIQGVNSRKIIDVLGYCPSIEVVHRDDLVIL